MNASRDSLFSPMLNAWCAYWFPAANERRLILLRAGIAAAAILYWGTYFTASATWFGPDGVLATSLAAKFVAYEQLPRWQVWSPLWWTDNLLVYRAWLIAGMGLSLLTALGVGGRWVPGILAAWLIAWAHRLSWLVGPTEPALVAMAAYLVVNPGPSLFTRRERRFSQSAGLTLRLVQTHVWILLAAGVLSQLASLIWWRGDAMWWLVAAERSNLLSIESLRQRPLMVNTLTHACIVVELLALWLLTTRSARWLGIAFGLLSCVVVGFLADYTLYAFALAAGLIAFSYLGDERQPETS